MDESLKLWFAVIGTPYLGYTKISPSRNFDDLREMIIKELGIAEYIKLWKVRQVPYYYNQFGRHARPRPEIPGHNPSRRRQNIVQQIGQIGPNLSKSVPVVHF